MTRLKVIVVLAAMVAFMAGAMVGLGRGRSGGGKPQDKPRSTLASELKLTAEQEARMRDIWSAVMEKAPDDFGKRREIEEQWGRDAMALLTPDQKAKYDELAKTYRARLDAMQKRHDEVFAQAIDETRKVLTPEQAAKYDAMMNERHGPHGPGDEPPPGHGPRMMLPGMDGGPGHGPGPGPEMGFGPGPGGEHGRRGRGTTTQPSAQ